MSARNWSVALSSLVCCAAVAAPLAIGSASLNPNSVLRTARPSPSMAGTRVAADGTRPYIVRFVAAPVAGYAGGVASLGATNPRTLGRRTLDVASGGSVAYAQYLAGQHADFLDRASRTLGRTLAPRFTYSYAFNGMALRLTPAEAAALEALPGVRYVQPDRAYRPVSGVPIPAIAANTEPSRAWIGADTVWSKQTFAGTDNEGEGMVVADLDTGVNAGNSSFKAAGLDGYTILNPLSHFLGVCDPNNTASGQPNSFDGSFSCNSKLIGAYTYTRYANSPSNDPHSPEDSEGHGSHTASTAAGDFTTGTLASGISSPLSGVAPHANLIMYDVCDPTDLCQQSESVAAVEQAIQDQSTLAAAAPGTFKGMVLNFSIGGSSDPYLDPVEQAFFSAEQAGIYVSVAGGNNGPQAGNTEGFGPVEHLGPWVATNAAATDDSVFTANTLSVAGIGAPAGPFNGLGATGGISSATEIVYAGNHPYAVTDYNTIEATYRSQKYALSGQAWATPSGGRATDAAACLFPFTPGTFPAGAIVVCDRGTIALVDKADNVKQGGAGGVVIVSQSGNPLIAQSYEIPGTMIDDGDGSSIEARLGTSDNTGFTATLSGSSLGTCGSSCSGVADQLAAFSSRGPNGNVYDNIVKPDLAAPGVQILAAVGNPCFSASAPGSCAPESFDLLQGTSMATPHDTGAAALLKQLHNSWTPMELKSALMSTAVTGTGDQCSVAGVCTSTLAAAPGPQAVGAGRIDVAAAARAGFVMDEPFTGQGALISNNSDADAATLQGFNLPSLGNNACFVICGWTRTVRATQALNSLTYTVSTGQSWLTVAVNGGAAGTSANFTLAPGATATLVFSARVPAAGANSWIFAEVDFASSTPEDDLAAPPAQHFPVAVFDQQPEPKMNVLPSALTASLGKDSGVQKQLLIVGNAGQATLSWSIVTGTTPSGSIVAQPADGASGTTFGYPSDMFTRDGHGIYAADNFTLPVGGSISAIATPGFTLAGSGSASLRDATSIAWYVYADGHGAPAGNPEKGGQLWTFSATPIDAGVDVHDGNDISLDLNAAGAPALQLPAGTYWLVVVPTFNSSCGFSGTNIIVGGCSGEAWYWNESAPGAGTASFIDPANLTHVAPGGSWSLMGPNTTTSKSASGSVKLAFTLSGTLTCSGSTPLSGVSIAPTSGNDAGGTDSDVTVTFNPAGLADGVHSGAVCIEGNDLSTPFIAVPITETVSSSGGGGGKGSMDLAALLLLAAAAWRRCA